MQYLCNILISSKQCQGKEKFMSKTSNINRLDYITKYLHIGMYKLL